MAATRQLKNKMKKVWLSLGTAVAVLIVLPMFAAFEAHVINVTATIENALAVSTRKIEFGTVFPEEFLLEFFDVFLSESFLREDRVDDVEYHIKQKDKPRDPGEPVCDPTGACVSSTEFCHENRPQNPGDPQDPYYQHCFPSLCPYLSKLDDERPDNDTSIEAFHRAECDDGTDNDGDGAVDWPADLECTSKYDDSEREPGQQGLVTGLLAKSQQDIEDHWTIDLHVPCFEGFCAQDNEIPNDYQLDPRLEHQTFGCDLWIEVNGVSTAPTPTPTPEPGTVTVTKVVGPEGTALEVSDFNLFVGAEPVDSGVGESFTPATYTVSETEASDPGVGYDTTIICDDDDFVDNGDGTGDITVEEGEVISCTITNTETD